MALLAWAAAPLAAAPQGELANCRTDYRIEASLDGESKVLTGELWATWSNESGEAVDDLWFHLYLNAFSNNRSTHLRESGGELRGVKIEDGWGWSRITSIEVSSGAAAAPVTDILPSLRYRDPDEEAAGRTEDRTVFSVDLPRPVASGESLVVHVRWESQLPRVRRRTGYKDEFLLVAQWFPKLGVYETGRGWNCHQFHNSTEFYSDFGTYDVSLDLPPAYLGKVFASGKGTTSEIVEGRLQVTFQAPHRIDRERSDAFGKRPLVHDFTWTADPDFVVENRIFRFAEWAENYPDEVQFVREVLGEEPSLRNVDVTVLIQPERVEQAERHYRATCAALFFYGLWFGEYPYQHITVVDPAFGGSAARGMEYPTLFTCGTRLFTTEDMHVPESVTVHECGHQFFYGLLGNNEFEAAWLDEGFNSFADSEVLWRVYGPSRSTTDFARLPVDGRPVAGAPGGKPLGDALVGKSLTVPLPFLGDFELKPLPRSGFVDLWRDQPTFTFVREWTDPRWEDRNGYLRDPDTDPVERNAWEYADRQSYRANSYPRPAVALRSLRGLVGDEDFLRGMRAYTQAWRYRHPYPADFYASFQEGAGRDVQWYFRELFQGTGTVDWSVSVDQKRRPEPLGFFQSEGGEFFERRVPEGDGGEAGEEAPEAPWSATVEIRRGGELRLPLPVRLTFEDGSVEEFVWTRQDQEGLNWIRIEREGEAKLISVQVDPERSYYLDENLSNNQWYDATEDRTAWRWGERVLAQYQRYFHWISGIGG